MKKLALTLFIACLIIFSTGCISRQEVLDYATGKNKENPTTTTPEVTITTILETTQEHSTTTTQLTTLQTSTPTTTTTTTTLYTNITCEGKWGDQAKDKCYLDVALEKKDPVICDTIVLKSNINSCYYKLAVMKKEPYLCEGIKDDLLRKRCYTYSV